jgi:hypothetical protein
VTTTRTGVTFVLTFAQVDEDNKVIKAVTENVSEPATQTFNSKTMFGQFIGEGGNWEAFGPHGPEENRERGLVCISVTWSSISPGVTRRRHFGGTRDLLHSVAGA